MILHTLLWLVGCITQLRVDERAGLVAAARLAQANYFRDPLRINEFLAHGACGCCSGARAVSCSVEDAGSPTHLLVCDYAAKFLPDLNNEKLPVNATYRANFMTLENLVLVRAEHDTQVFPKESEWFGAYADGDAYKRVLGFNETKWYRDDSFGLQSLDRAGKVHFLSTEGNHLQFSSAFLLEVVSKYFSTPTQLLSTTTTLLQLSELTRSGGH